VRSTPSSIPVELVAAPEPPAPEAAPPPPPPPAPAASPRARPRPQLRERPERRRLARSNPEPAASTPTASGSPGAGLLASPGAPEGSGPGGHGPGAGPSGSAPAPQSKPPAPRAEPTSPPRALEAPPPAYPLAARRRRAEGLTLVRARVGREGRVIEVAVAQSSGADDLDRAALEAVRVWRFQPGTRGPTPVEAWIKVPVRFQLRSSL
jgi:protein TonB